MFINDALVGVVIGTNRANHNEAIAATHELLVNLAEQIVGGGGR